MKLRLLGIQALETARCFEEKVLTDVREADVGSILGFGFAPFSGGTLSWIDMMGTKKFVELCRSLEKKYGDRFAPSKLLIEMAEKGESFYGRFAPKDESGGVNCHSAAHATQSNNNQGFLLYCWFRPSAGPGMTVTSPP